MEEMTRDLARTTLAVLFMCALIAASLWIVRPFLPAIVWGAMIVIATWPVMLKAQALLWGSRPLAVLVMITVLLLALVLPLSFAVIAIVGSVDEIATWVKTLASLDVPPPPEWVEHVPIVGSVIAQSWRDLTGTDFAGLTSEVAPYAYNVTKWLISQAGGVGVMLVHFVLTAIVAAILYARGEVAAELIQRFGRRLAGQRGEISAKLAGQAIRGVALGVIVTAVVQAALGGIGLAIAGVPSAAVLTAVMFMLCIAQVGPIFVLLPAIIWTFWTGNAVWGTFLFLWSVPVFALDNVLRPILIRRGADLPLLLIFVGVIGGLLSFGLVGIFVGPVILAVAYTLLQAWVGEPPHLDSDGEEDYKYKRSSIASLR